MTFNSQTENSVCIRSRRTQTPLYPTIVIYIHQIEIILIVGMNKSLKAIAYHMNSVQYEEFHIKITDLKTNPSDNIWKIYFESNFYNKQLCN